MSAFRGKAVVLAYPSKLRFLATTGQSITHILEDSSSMCFEAQ
jgi:hypothetical protein